jgi:hypothetical protein
MGIRSADHARPLYPQKMALTSPTSGGRSVGIVRLRTKATEFSFLVNIYKHLKKLFDKEEYCLPVWDAMYSRGLLMFERRQCLYSYGLKLLHLNLFSLHFLLQLPLQHWWWRFYLSLKRRWICTRLHGITSQETVLFIMTATKTSVFTFFFFKSLPLSLFWNEFCFCCCLYHVKINVGRKYEYPYNSRKLLV